MIRACDDEDLQLVYEIINDAAIAYKGVIPDDCWREPYMPLDELRREAAEVTFYGLEESDGLAGVIGYQPRPDVPLQRHLSVHPGRQRPGIGSALLS